MKSETMIKKLNKAIKYIDSLNTSIKKNQKRPRNPEDLQQFVKNINASRHLSAASQYLLLVKSDIEYWDLLGEKEGNHEET